MSDFKIHRYKSDPIDIYGNYKEFTAREEKQMKVVNDTKFNTWKREVDQLCVAHFGLSTDDLPDAPWRDYHEDEQSPGEAISCALDDAWYDEYEEMEALWYGSAA